MLRIPFKRERVASDYLLEKTSFLCDRHWILREIQVSILSVIYNLRFYGKISHGKVKNILYLTLCKNVCRNEGYYGDSS